MRILDEDHDKAFCRVTVLLTASEADELRDSLTDLLSSGINGNHTHIPSDDYTKEITISLYTHEELSSFSSRYQLLIKEDK